MTLLEHLEELRRRIIWSLLALVGGALGAFSFSPAIVRFLAAPILRFLPPGSKLAYLGVTEPFLLYFKVSLLVGAFLAFPVILLQVWLFISPGLYPHERRWAGPFIFLGWFFFVLGGAFAFYVAFPFAVEFLQTQPPGRIGEAPSDGHRRGCGHHDGEQREHLRFYEPSRLQRDRPDPGPSSVCLPEDAVSLRRQGHQSIARSRYSPACGGRTREPFVACHRGRQRGGFGGDGLQLPPVFQR